MEQTFGEKLKTLGGVHYHLDESINFENGWAQGQEKSLELMAQKGKRSHQRRKERIEQVRKEFHVTETEPQTNF